MQSKSALRSEINFLALDHGFKTISSNEVTTAMSKTYCGVSITLRIKNISYYDYIVVHFMAVDKTHAELTLQAPCLTIKQFTEYLDGIYKIMDASIETPYL